VHRHISMRRAIGVAEVHGADVPLALSGLGGRHACADVRAATVGGLELQLALDAGLLLRERMPRAAAN